MSTLNSGWTSGTLITASRSSYVTIAYYARIKAPTSDTYTIYIEVDDTAKVFIDSTLIISNGYGNYSTTVSMNYDQYHELIIYFSQNTGDAEVILSWSYTGQSKVIIPSQYLYYPTYVSSSPIQVTVSCPTGYTGSNPSSTTKCIEIPGDGLRVGIEECDDGNLINGDGCNSTMYIEYPWVCDGGSSTSADYCFECTSGFEQNSKKSECQIIGTPKSIVAFAITIFVIVVIGIKINLATSILKGRYPHGVFLMIEQLQLVAIFPLIGTAFPSDIMVFFRTMRHFLLSLDVIEFQSVLFRNYGYYHRFLNMRLLAFSSGSTIVNIINWIMIINALIIILLIYHFISGILCYKKKNGFLTMPLWRFSKWTFPGFFTRYINLGYLMILITTIFEINRMQRKLSWSMNLAYLMISLLGVYYMIVLISTCVVIIFPNTVNFYLIREFFIGLRETRISKFYLLIFLSHRIIISCVIMIDNNLTFTGKVGVFVGLEALYILYLLWSFPFSNWKDNFMKILNECFMLIYLLPLFYYSSIDKWISNYKWTFLGFIVANCTIISFNFFGFFMIRIIKEKRLIPRYIGQLHKIIIKDHRAAIQKIEFLESKDDLGLVKPNKLIEESKEVSFAPQQKSNADELRKLVVRYQNGFQDEDIERKERIEMDRLTPRFLKPIISLHTQENFADPYNSTRYDRDGGRKLYMR